jgi:ATP-dependent Clp protease protease subunit
VNENQNRSAMGGFSILIKISSIDKFIIMSYTFLLNIKKQRGFRMKEITFFKEVNNETIAELIEKCREEKEIKLLLNSCGGNPIAARAFYNFIRSHSIKLHVDVLGVCDSSALVILCAGQKRTAAKNTTFMLHRIRNTFKDSRMTVEEMKESFIDLKKLEASYRKIIFDTTKQPKSVLNKMFIAEKDITANQAFKIGLLTEKPR